MLRSVFLFLIYFCAFSIVRAQSSEKPHEKNDSITLNENSADNLIFFSTEVGFMFGKPISITADDASNYVGMVYGHYKINDYFNVAVGTGVSDILYISFPIAARTEFSTKGKYGLVLNFESAYIIPLNYEWKNENWQDVTNKNGMYVGGSIGVQKVIAAQNRFFLGFTYRYFELKTETTNEWWNGEQTITDRYYLHRFALTMGLKF